MELTLAVNYRKSLSADSAFPACLWDALAGWQYLIEELGFRPEVRCAPDAKAEQSEHCRLWG